MTEETVEAITRDLLAEAREELTRADTKTSLSLAGAAVLIGTTASSIASSGWRPSGLSNAVEWLFWLGVAVAGGGVTAAACAISPRYRRNDVRPNHPLMYFGDAARYDSSEALVEALREGPTSSLSRSVDQLLAVSRIVNRKYLLLEVSLVAFGVAPILCGVAAIIG